MNFKIIPDTIARATVSPGFSRPIMLLELTLIFDNNLPRSQGANRQQAGRKKHCKIALAKCLEVIFSFLVDGHFEHIGTTIQKPLCTTCTLTAC